MECMTFRIDDVCANTDFDELNDICQTLYERFDCRFLMGVTLLCKKNSVGSVYPDAPFKHRPFEFFLDVNNLYTAVEELRGRAALFSDIASHGLFHVNHAQIGRAAKKMSIVGSCNLLGTKVFIPPFGTYDAECEEICKDNGIRLVNESEGWNSLESHPFDWNHKKWYFHPWRDEIRKFVRELKEAKVK